MPAGDRLTTAGSRRPAGGGPIAQAVNRAPAAPPQLAHPTQTTPTETDGCVRTGVDPMRSSGRWLVRTASGALHLIDSTAGGQTVTVTRVTADPAADDPRFPRGSLRRDDEPIRLSAVQHLCGTHLVDGVALGADMYLTLEPLAPDAAATLRRTTPVVAIDELASPGPS